MIRRQRKRKKKVPTICSPPMSVVKRIVEETDSLTGIPACLILDGKNLDRRVTAARRKAIKLLHAEGIYSLRGIGSCFGISGCQVLRHVRKPDEEPRSMRGRRSPCGDTKQTGPLIDHGSERISSDE